MMGIRERILLRIKQNRPSEMILPSEFYASQKDVNLVETFIETISHIGGKACIVNNWQSLSHDILKSQEIEKEYIVALPELPGYNAEMYKYNTPSELESIKTAYLKGSYAIAENGAIWIEEKDMVTRILPFICQRLVIIIDKEKIFADMHDAYKNIKFDSEGYGVFIAGPSKTADIEQALVIGAHGPMELMVYIIDDLTLN